MFVFLPTAARAGIVAARFSPARGFGRGIGSLRLRDESAVVGEPLLGEAAKVGVRMLEKHLVGLAEMGYAVVSRVAETVLCAAAVTMGQPAARPAYLRSVRLQSAEFSLFRRIEKINQRPVQDIPQ